nr:PREDICTED: facilitated trehalose transporter Tret1-like [Bemisia tabaci]
MFFKISKGIRRQLLAAFCCCIGAMTLGAIAGWSAAAFPKIRNNELEFRLSLFQEAWVINAFYIGIMMGPLPAGIMMDAIGRKSTLLFFSTFAITNWTLVTLAYHEHMLYLARFCAGLWAGSVTTVVPAFLAEVLQPNVRGSLGTMYFIMYFAGNLYEYIIGPYVTYFTFGISSGLLCFVFATSFVFIPETPYYYIMKGKRKKAEASLRWLRGDEDVSAELESIQTYVKTFMKRRGRFKELILNENYRAAFINVQAVYFIQKLCGMFTVLAYLTLIIPSQVGPLSPEHCTLITGVVLWLSVFVATSLIDRVGRKPLFVISNIGIIITMTITGVWYFLNVHSDMDLSSTTWIPFSGLLLYGVSFCLGVGPIASLYQGEVLPSNIKARASTVTAIISAFASILNTTLFAICASYIGMYINFFLFALTSVFALYFAQYHFIETKGKTLQEIQEELRKKPGFSRETSVNSNYSTVSSLPAIYTVPIARTHSLEKSAIANSLAKNA